MNKPDPLVCVNKVLSAVEEIVKTQSEQKCRKNVFETLGLLMAYYPENVNHITTEFRRMCKDYNKDFFKEIRWDDIAQELRSMNDE